MFEKKNKNKRWIIAKKKPTGETKCEIQNTITKRKSSVKLCNPPNTHTNNVKLT